MPLPLAGLQVLDFSNVLAGPYCTMVLADLGAEVTKVEAIPHGDGSRRFAPLVNGESYCFAVLNRNKQSIALDLKHAEGRAVATALAARADIIVENFRPGVAARLGLGYDTVCAYNPEVVYASVSGFGQNGPSAHKGGFDIVAQGMSGIMLMTGEAGGRPAKVGIAMNDLAAGATALWGILGALVGRLRHGGGRYLETSLLEAGLAWTFWEAGAYFGAGEEPVATGTRHRRSAPYQAFRTADGYVTVGANGERLWQAFCEKVCARPEWLRDPRFADAERRLAHVEELEATIEAVLTTAPTAHWVARLDDAGVPGGPVYSYVEALADPQVRARAMVVEMDHARIGPMRLLGVPVKADEPVATIRTPAPWLGQHSAATLAALGYDDDTIARLFAAGVIHDALRDG